MRAPKGKRGGNRRGDAYREADLDRWERIYRERFEDRHYYAPERSLTPSTLAVVGKVRFRRSGVQ